jgi:WD40 repeat protein
MAVGELSMFNAKLRSVKKALAACEAARFIRAFLCWRRLQGLQLICQVLAMFAFLFIAIHQSLVITHIPPVATLLDNDCALTYVSVTPDSSAIVTSSFQEGAAGNTIRFWDFTGSQRFVVSCLSFRSEPVRFSQDGSVFAFYTPNGSIKVCCSNSGRELTTISKQNQHMHDVELPEFTISPTNEWLAFGDNIRDRPAYNAINFWNIPRGQKQATIEADINTLAFAPDGRSFVTYATDQQRSRILRWIFSPNGIPLLEKGFELNATAIALSKDLKIVAGGTKTGSESVEIGIWDMKSGAKRCSINYEGKDSPLFAWISLACNGQLLFGSFMSKRMTGRIPQGESKLWDVSGEPKYLGTFALETQVSADAAWLASPRKEGADLIRLPGMEKLGVLVNATDEERSPISLRLPKCTFAPDGKTVAIGGLHLAAEKPWFNIYLPSFISPGGIKDRALGARVWDVNTRQEAIALEECTGLVYSNDSKYLVTRHGAHAVRIWKVPFEIPLCVIVKRATLILFMLACAGWLMIRLLKKALIAANPSDLGTK